MSSDDAGAELLVLTTGAAVNRSLSRDATGPRAYEIVGDDAVGKRTGAANGQQRVFRSSRAEVSASGIATYVRSQRQPRGLVQDLVRCRLLVVTCARMR